MRHEDTWVDAFDSTCIGMAGLCQGVIVTELITLKGRRSVI